MSYGTICATSILILSYVSSFILSKINILTNSLHQFLPNYFSVSIFLYFKTLNDHVNHCHVWWGTFVKKKKKKDDLMCLNVRFCTLVSSKFPSEVDQAHDQCWNRDLRQSGRWRLRFGWTAWSQWVPTSAECWTTLHQDLEAPNRTKPELEYFHNV